MNVKRQDLKRESPKPVRLEAALFALGRLVAVYAAGALYTSASQNRPNVALFNRSWYNRAGVEHVMKFCSRAEYESFLKQVLPFEHMLIGSGIQIMKYYLDISRREQKKRLKARAADPLRQWKESPIDCVALEHWDDYTKARNKMLERSSNAESPWIVVKADNKHEARLNVIRDLLTRLDCPGGRKHLAHPDRDIVFEYSRDQFNQLAE
ncbi:MAG TPA: hypothetical protein VN154_13120 [Rhizomicrobium sp.]|nr:hypothetical protein [Rhizomicrobium sp.]